MNRVQTRLQAIKAESDRKYFGVFSVKKRQEEGLPFAAP
jgi:hypothetical protein